MNGFVETGVEFEGAFPFAEASKAAWKADAGTAFGARVNAAFRAPSWITL
jgi:hypothetical protein